MKKACAVPLLLVGIVLLGLGAYAADRGFEARDLVREQLLAEELTTPAGASVPNERVDDAVTARSFADYIGGAVKEATGGRNYAEVGRYLTSTGGDTNDPAAAARGSDGMPVPNPLRETAFEVSTATTGLYTSVMAFHIGELAVGLGIVLFVLGAALAVTGLVLSGLRVPAVVRSRIHVPHLHAPHAS